MLWKCASWQCQKLTAIKFHKYGCLLISWKRTTVTHMLTWTGKRPWGSALCKEGRRAESRRKAFTGKSNQLLYNTKRSALEKHTRNTVVVVLVWFGYYYYFFGIGQPCISWTSAWYSCNFWLYKNNKGNSLAHYCQSNVSNLVEAVIGVIKKFLLSKTVF